jgi:hypothetical protein
MYNLSAGLRAFRNGNGGPNGRLDRSILSSTVSSVPKSGLRTVAKSTGVSLTVQRLVVRMCVSCSRWTASLLAMLLCSNASHAHVMQQLSWYQVERTITVKPGSLRVHHDFKFDKNMYRADDPILDVDGDSTASQHEIAQFCQASSNYVSQDFTVLADGLPCAVRQESFSVYEDDSGFSDDLVADLPDLPSSGTQTLDIVDPSYLFSFPADNATTTTPIIAEPGLTLQEPQSTASASRVMVPKAPHVAVRLNRSNAATEARKP